MTNHCTYNFTEFITLIIIATTIGYGRNVPETESGKAFCIGFILLGIPYFAYMIACISEDINTLLKGWKKRNELTKQRTGSSIMLAYTFAGSIMLIIIPSWIFRYMEGTYSKKSRHGAFCHPLTCNNDVFQCPPIIDSVIGTRLFYTQWVKKGHLGLTPTIGLGLLNNFCFNIGWSFLDCIYFSLISLSTVGFGDFVPRNSPPIQFGRNT